MIRLKGALGFVAFVLVSTLAPCWAADPAPPAKEADVSLHVLNVILDAPWRVQVRSSGSYVPIMFFFPETKQGWRKIKVLSMRLSEVGSQGMSLLFEDTSKAAPVFGSSTSSPFTGRTMTVVNGYGAVSSDLDIVRDHIDPRDPAATFAVSEVNDDNRGWHTILRLPVPPAAVASGTGQVALLAEVEYRRIAANDDQVYTIRRRLHVALDRQPLPSFPGWRSFDVHAHTCAEYSSDLSYRAIRKAFGGPVQMMKECSLAVGLIDSTDQFKDNVITTDHNSFFCDHDSVRYGPTQTGIAGGATQVLHPEMSPEFVDLEGKPTPEGQREYENYMDLYGLTFGQELTLAKPGPIWDSVTGTLGSHLLTYRSRYFSGPFHGGRFFVFRDEPNPNTLDFVLSKLATDPRHPNAFCFAAHPFSTSWIDRRFLFAWTRDQIDTAIHGNYIRFDGDKEREFVFKGFELWNGRKSRRYATNSIDTQRILSLLEDPTNEPAWKEGLANYDENLNLDLQIFHQAIADCLSIQSTGAHCHRHIRKFYLAAGSDAHGDFNRESDMIARGLWALPAQILRFFKAFSVSDNAFGKLRTVVRLPTEGEKGFSDSQPALYAYAHGQGVATDGPVIDFALDANGHFDSAHRRWHAAAAFENEDGMIGGTGDMDGGRSVLVAEGGNDVMVRFRTATSPSFGGELERIEIYRDEAGGTVRLATVQRPSGKAKVLAWQGNLDPRLPADSSGWRVARLRDGMVQSGQATGPIRCLSAFSLGGFTRWLNQPPFDFRCYTNPIWTVPIRLSVRVGSGSNSRGLAQGHDFQAATTGVGTIAPGDLSITFSFPISMSTDACEVRIVPIGPDGSSSGDGTALVPVGTGTNRSGWSANPREPVADSVLQVVNPTAIVPIGTGMVRAEYCLYIAGVSDVHGNRLNPVAWRLISTSTGLEVDPGR